MQFSDLSTPGGAADAWRWTFGAPSASSTSQHPVYTYTQAGVYTVTLHVTDTTGNEWDIVTRTRYLTVTPRVDFEAAPLWGKSPLTASS